MSAFTVVAKDGSALESATPVQVTVNVSAVNDAASSISGTMTGQVYEDELANARGTLNVSDIDNSGFAAQSNVRGDYGVFNLSNSGSWYYSLANDTDNVQALTSGEQQTDSFTVTSEDGTAISQIIVYINGIDEPITEDWDGVDNSIEEQVPSGSGVSGDGNGDGVADTEQTNVTSLPTNKNVSDSTSNAAPVFLSIALPAGQTLTDATITPVKDTSALTFQTQTLNAKGEKVVVDSPITPAQAPFGLFSFKLEGIASSHDSSGKTVGGTSEVKLYLDGNQNIDKYLKKTVSGNYETIPFKADFDGKLKKTVITLSLTDGDKFDLDGKVNGAIDDPGTPILKLTSVNSVAGGSLSIDGTAKQGNVLHANNALTDLNGLGTLHYQWLADGKVIDKATADNYAPTQQEVGKTVSVNVSYTDLAGFSETVTSKASAIIPNINDAPTGVMSIKGIIKQGETLTASNNTLSDLDGLGVMSYQWSANGKVIKGATSDHYTLAQIEVGKKIMVSASYIDGFGTKESVKSLATVQVKNVNDTPKGNVKITNSSQDADTIMTSENLSDLDGLGSIKHQWMSGDTILTKAKGSVYTITNHDVGKWISVAAQYSDKLGSKESVNSDSLYINAMGTTKNDVLVGSNNNDYISGKSGDDSIQGGNGNDVLKGNQGNDTLIGGSGDDQLYGGLGKNVLTGGAGKDAFYLSLEKSTITDFNPQDELLLFDRNIFKALKKLGQLTLDTFDSYLTYNKATGELSYDDDANGLHKPVVIAQIGTNLDLTMADFSVFASQGLIGF